MRSSFIREVCAMKGLTLTAFLLCGSSWILAAGSDPLVVEVQLGVNVTLQCSNISAYRTHAEWLRVVKGAEPSCVASMFDPHLEDSLCPGFESRKFKMTSDITNLFLHINRVDFSDSGLYFCGFYIKKFTVIPRATLLNVQGDPSDDNNSNHQNEPDEMAKLPLIFLVALILIFVIVIVVLAFKVRRQRGVNQITQPERNKTQDSDSLNYAAVTFQAPPRRMHRRELSREVETNVVYSTTRVFAAEQGAAAF